MQYASNRFEPKLVTVTFPEMPGRPGSHLASTSAPPMLLEEFVRLARALALVIAALLLLAHAAAAQGMEPPTVVDAFARARVAQDVDATMAEFADDAVVRVDHVRPRIMNGKKEIRELFDELSIEAPTLLAQPRSTATDTLTWSERVLEAHYGTIDLT